MLDNIIEHYIENAVDTKHLGGYIANFKRFKKYIKPGKEGFVKSAYSAYRERSLGLGAMGFHVTSSLNRLRLKASLLRALTIRHLALLKTQPLKPLRAFASYVVSVLTYMVGSFVMLTFLLLLLMLALVLFVVGLVLLLSLTVLMHIPTKLYQALTRSKTNTSQSSSNEKNLEGKN